MTETIRQEICEMAEALFSVLLAPESLEQEAQEHGIALLWPDNGEAFSIGRKVHGNTIQPSELVVGNQTAILRSLMEILSDTPDVWLYYASHSGVPLPPLAEAPRLENVLLEQGVTAFYPVSGDRLQTAFGLPKDQLSVEEHVLLRAHFGEEWMTFSAIVTPPKIPWLGDKARFAQVEIGCVTPYGETAPDDFQVYMAAHMALLAEQPNAAFFATVVYEEQRASHLQFDINVDANLRRNLGDLGLLLGDQDEWRLPEDIPVPEVAIHGLSGEISLADGGGLTELSGRVSANFGEGWSPLGDGPDNLKHLFNLQSVTLDFDWQPGFPVTWQISGDVEIATYQLQARYQHPAQIVDLALSPTNTSKADISGFLKDIGVPSGLLKDIGVPEVATQGVDSVLTDVSLAVYANLAAKEIEIIVRNSHTWPLIGEGFKVSNMDLRLYFAPVGASSYSFVEAMLYAEMALPIGPKNDAGQREAVTVQIDALYDRLDNLWSFDGETDAGDEIMVGEVMDALLAKLNDGKPKEQIPEAIRSLVVENISLHFDNQGEIDFVCETILEIEGQELDFWIHLQREDGELKLAGSLFIHGIRLAVAFSSQENDKYVVGSLTFPLTIDTRDIVAALAPHLAADIPIHVEAELQGLLLALHTEKSPRSSSQPSPENRAGKQSAGNEYLFRLLFNLDFGLDGFPLIGKMLEDVKFANGQLLAANKDLSAADIGSVNELLPLIEPEAPPPIEAPGSDLGIDRGISLSGVFQITEEFKFPLYLHFGSSKSRATRPDGAKALPAGNAASQKSGGAVVVDGGSAPSETPPAGKTDQRSQSKIDRIVGAVRIKKVGFIFEKGRLGLKITGGLALAAFEFELSGMQVTVPQSILNDPSQVTDIDFALDGFEAEIHKGTLSIMGAFLRQHHEDPDEDGNLIPYDEFSGLIQVAFPPLNLTGMGAYAMYQGHPSLFLFAALGFPIPLSPALLLEGLALGFGIHRDFIPPKLDEILTYPLIQVAVTPPPPMDIAEMAEKMHQYFPPAADLYFIVVGVKFKAFGLVDSVVMAAVKFGKEFELDLIGVSSILFPATFIELAWLARFVPESGYLLIRGELTERSYLLIPQVHLTGGFAVAAWAAGVYQGDFVVSIGGYHPQYNVPAHYPNHISRLGIRFHLAPITVEGGVYFAITPQCLMLGGFLDASFEESLISAHLKMALDAIIFFEPFFYDVHLGMDASVRASIPFPIHTIHIDVHLHVDAHIWGPEFSGQASLDVGPKTFDAHFGKSGAPHALPIGWDAFQQKFLQDGKGVCAIAVTEGLINTVKDSDKEIFVVDSRKVAIEIKSVIPATGKKPSNSLGIVPMNVPGGRFSAELGINIETKHQETFTQTEIFSAVPSGIWGNSGLQQADISGATDALVRNVHTGYRLTPGKERETSETHALPKDTFAYNTDEFLLLDQISVLEIVAAEDLPAFQVPENDYEEFTGLTAGDLVQAKAEDFLQSNIFVFDLQ